MGEPTVLGMINENLGEIKEDIKEIKGDLKNGAVKLENHEQRMLSVEKKATLNENVTLKHIENKEKHYNPYHSESFGQKVRRKKGEIGIASAGGGLIGLLIFLIDKFM